MHFEDQKESTQETSQESQNRAPAEMLLATGKKGPKKAAHRTACERAFH